MRTHGESMSDGLDSGVTQWYVISSQTMVTHFLCRWRRRCGTMMYHHLFTLSARSYTIPRNFCDAFSTPVAINLIRFRDFGERLIGEDARGSSSKGLLVYPPLVLAATVCGYDRTRYVARTVQQLLLASTTRRRDGSRRNKREKA